MATLNLASIEAKETGEPFAEILELRGFQFVGTTKEPPNGWYFGLFIDWIELDKNIIASELVPPKITQKLRTLYKKLYDDLPDLWKSAVGNTPPAVWYIIGEDSE
jgi:hypothetical protein